MSARRAIADAVDGAERLSADDQATQREGQFLAAALAAPSSYPSPSAPQGAGGEVVGGGQRRHPEPNKTPLKPY